MTDCLRYIRQLNLIGQDGQDALARSHVLCIGLGGLGTLVSSYLVAAGIGNISLLDGDSIELHNLTRQISYNETNCSQSKVLTQARFLQKLNSNCMINTYDFFIGPDNAAQPISQHDLIIDCSDNFKTRYLISDVCAAFEKPLISASIEGFIGQVMVLLQDVCYRCVFPKVDHEANTCFNGDVIGPAVGIIASMQANEAIKFITNLNRTSRLIQLNSLDNTITQFAIRADLACINNHNDIIANQDIKYISYDEVMELDKKHQFQIIDLRNNSLDEYINQIQIKAKQTNNIDKLSNLDKDVVVICNYGFRSRLAALKLSALGYKHIYYSYVVGL